MNSKGALELFHWKESITAEIAGDVTTENFTIDDQMKKTQYTYLKRSDSCTLSYVVFLYNYTLF